MTKAVINIGVDVEDTFFNFPQQVMSDIVDALHNNDKVEIHFKEGVALEELNYKEKKFLQILKELCDQNSWPLDKDTLCSTKFCSRKIGMAFYRIWSFIADACFS